MCTTQHIHIHTLHMYINAKTPAEDNAKKIVQIKMKLHTHILYFRSKFIQIRHTVSRRFSIGRIICSCIFIYQRLLLIACGHRCKKKHFFSQTSTMYTNIHKKKLFIICGLYGYCKRKFFFLFKIKKMIFFYAYWIHQAQISLLTIEYDIRGDMKIYLYFY